MFPILLTSIPSAIKTGLQRYRDISYTIGGVNQMWILKIVQNLSEYIQSKSLSCTKNKTFDLCTFSTLYTSFLHSKVENRLKELLRLCFSNWAVNDTTLTFTLTTELYHIRYSNACAVILSWRNKNHTVVSMVWLTGTQYPTVFAGVCVAHFCSLLWGFLIVPLVSLIFISL